jgi:hypothetical protein
MQRNWIQTTKWLTIVAFFAVGLLAGVEAQARGYEGPRLKKPVKPAGMTWGGFFKDAYRAKMALASTCLKSSGARGHLYANLKKYKPFRSLPRPSRFAGKIVAVRANTINDILKDQGIKLTAQQRSRLSSGRTFWNKLLRPGTAGR